MTRLYPKRYYNLVKKDKVAILISGPLRTFNEVWPRNEEILSKLGFDYFYFLHTWSENFMTHKNFTDIESNKLVLKNISPVKISNATLNIADSIAHLPKTWNIQIENFESIKKNMPKISELPSEFHVLNCQNSLGMYYGMDRVALSAIESKIDFLYFLRIRSDFLLPKSFNFSDSDKIKMYGLGVSIFGTRISDQCFSSKFTNIKSMLVYQPLIKKINSGGWINQDLKIRRCGENALYEHLLDHKLLEKTDYPKWRGVGKIVRKLEHDDGISFLRFQQKVFKRNLKVLRKNVIKLLIRLFYFFKNAKKS